MSEPRTIPAVRVRQRLHTLSRVGVGRKAVHEFTGIDHRTLGRIKNGQTRRVRRETGELIFSVPMNAFCDKALIDATETWRIINRMLNSVDMGFTQMEIARRLGRDGGRRYPNLQIGKVRVTARTAMEVERFYGQVTAVGKSLNPCSTIGCEDEQSRRGMCSNCYQRWRKSRLVIAA